MTNCLEDDDVARFVGEPASSAWRTTREAHIASCGPCRARVALAMIDLDVAVAREPDDFTVDATHVHAARPFRWSEGDQVGGYRLLEVLGRGGMGIVFAARHVATGGERALKFITFPDEKGSRRLLREARAMHVAHPVIVPVEEVLRDVDLAPVLVMPRLRGRTLATRLALGERPTLDEAGRIVSSIGLALAEIHRAGVVHRDVKAANVFLEDSGAARLLDFGLVWLDDAHDPQGQGTRLTTTASIVGTPRYLAPEVVHGSLATPRSDLWALGHVAFEALTGERAMRVATAGALLREIARSGPLSRADERDPRVPRAVADVVASLLEKDPMARPVSADVAVALWREAFVSSGISL